MKITDEMIREVHHSYADFMRGKNDGIADIMRWHITDTEKLRIMIDSLLAHCRIGECEECSKIICPHKDEMHFHHDGCPSCCNPNQQTEGTI